MRRRTRPLPLALVVVAHVLVVGLLVLGERRFGNERTMPGELVYILPISPPSRDRPDFAESPQLRPRPIRRDSPVPPALSPAMPSGGEEPETSAITLPAPAVDWQLELQRSARTFGQTESSAARYRSLNSQPEVMTLPKRNEEPPSGTVTLLPNGDRMAEFKVGDMKWVCYSPQIALDEVFSVWAKFRPAKCGPKGRVRHDEVPPPAPRAYLDLPLPLGPREPDAFPPADGAVPDEPQ